MSVSYSLIIRFKKSALCGGMIEIPHTDTKGLGRKWGVNGILTYQAKSDSVTDIKRLKRFLLRRKDSFVEHCVKVHHKHQAQPSCHPEERRICLA
jgi:hypothetical protein